MKFRKIAILAAVIFSLGIAPVVFAEDNKSVSAEFEQKRKDADAKEEFAMEWWDKRSITELKDIMPKPVYALLAWPSPNALKKMRVIEKNVFGVKHALYDFNLWQNKILSESWKPPKDAEWLYIQKEDGHYDSIRVKWQKAAYDIEQIQGGHFVVLQLTRLDKASFGKDVNERIQALEKLTFEIFPKQYFYYGVLIKDYPQNLKHNFLASRVRTFIQNGNLVIYRVYLPIPEPEGRWCETISWFNDKNVFCMYFSKQTGDEAIHYGYESFFDWFNIGSRAAYLKGCEEADKLNIKYNKKEIQTNHKDGLWNIIFNPGENTETTVILDAVTGNVIDVVKKSIGQEKN